MLGGKGMPWAVGKGRQPIGRARPSQHPGGKTLGDGANALPERWWTGVAVRQPLRLWWMGGVARRPEVRVV